MLFNWDARLQGLDLQQKEKKRFKHAMKLFRKNLRAKGVC